MNIKRYIAATSQEALHMVKKEMGPEAVILRTRTLYPSKGDPEEAGKRIEMTAAVDYEPCVEEPSGAGSADLKTIMDRVQSLETDFREVREAVLSAEAGSLLMPDIYYNRVLRNRYLNYRGFGLRPEIISRFMKDHPGGAETGKASGPALLQESLTRVLGRIPISGGRRQPGPRRIVSFMGPTGVGKTTTLAKLAALSAIQQGRKTALITVDTFRVAAVAQLETYARIMGVPLEVAVSSKDLLKAVQKHRECDVILIDTAGTSPNRKESILELKNILSIPEEIHGYLVLSATTRYQDLQHADEQFGVLPVKSCIFTKLDETKDPSAMINFLISRGRPVSYFATGQQVPEDIEEVSRKRLASLLLSRMRKGTQKPTNEVNVDGSGEWTEKHGSRLQG